MNKHQHDVASCRQASWRVSRRVIVKAAASVAALAATGGFGQQRILRAIAQDEPAPAGETLAYDWYESSETGGISAAEAGAPRLVEAQFPFYAIGAHWDEAAGITPLVELSFSSDGRTFSSPIVVGAALEDIGRPTRNNRIFTNLIFTGGSRFVRYRTLDAAGNPIIVPGFALTYIDATAGPTAGDAVTAAALPTLQKPAIVSRAGWGADESYRFDQYGEVWPREYQRVEHIIVHHSGTASHNGAEPFSVVRSIYYYHAITLGWGDIGYNYLVSAWGHIFEGRYGGENVVGGHAYQYAWGSSGICAIGDYSFSRFSEDGQAALIAIIAWVGRNLDPLGRSTFHEAYNLPTIAGHRDVNQSTCPGDGVWNSLPTIRNAVAEVLNSTDSPPDSEVPPPPNVRYGIGDNVITDRQLYLRSAPSPTASSYARLPAGTLCAITGAPRIVDGEEWYYVLTYTSQNYEGYFNGRYLDPAPVGNPPEARFRTGDQVRFMQGSDLRRSPGLPQRVIGYVPAGAVMTVSAETVAATGQRWVPVYSTTYAGGWVDQEVLTLERPAPDPAEIALSRYRGSVATSFTVFLSHFPPNASVAIQWDGTKRATIVTDGSGQGSGDVQIPPSVKGMHTVRAVAGSVSAETQFEVIPRVHLSPREGQIGSRVTVTARGYGANETIEIQWPQGEDWVTIKTRDTGSTGSMRTLITVPDFAVPGKAYVRGLSPTGDHKAPFTVLASSTSEVQTPTPEPTPEATSTPEPSATTQPTEEPTATPTETPVTEPTQTPAPELTETPVIEEPTAEPSPTVEPAATETP